MIHRFEILPHTADLRLRVSGKTKEELFKNALQGMFFAMSPKRRFFFFSFFKGSTRRGRDLFKKRRSFKIEAPDINALLVNFLNEALTSSDVRNEAYNAVNFKIFKDTIVSGELVGYPIKKMRLEIKAVTFHELDIKKVNGLWQTNIVFDI